MNERIRQLAEQATSYADTLDVADQKIYQKIRDREFAELIVHECARIGELKEQGCEDYDPNLSVGWYMKQYFEIR